MHILAKTAARFKHGFKHFLVVPGQVTNAPDWIIHDPHFWLMYEHAERAKDYPFVSGHMTGHPQGTEPLLEVIGEQPKKPADLEVPKPSDPQRQDAMNINTIVPDLNTPLTSPQTSGLILPTQSNVVVDASTLSHEELEAATNPEGDKTGKK